MNTGVQDITLSPTDFVALFNQTVEFAYPAVAIQGEISSLKVSKNRWVYFDLKDEYSSLRYFGTVYQLPGPLADGLVVRAVGAPRLHPKFGFTINLQSVQPVGAGSLKKAADLVRAKLTGEGLFSPERKRALPAIPQTVGLITAAGSAAYSDFIKILAERWGGVTVQMMDVYVQGEQAPSQLVAAIKTFNALSLPPEVLVITRGGGSAEDLSAFSDERVVRAVAASRIPTLVAVGHETDESLAELAADQRASTPTNAASVLVPDRRHQLEIIRSQSEALRTHLQGLYNHQVQGARSLANRLTSAINSVLERQTHHLKASRQLAVLFDPRAALKRGYAIVSKGTNHISRVGQVRVGDNLGVELADGKLKLKTTQVLKVK
ncbi:MAG: exodeoxyribonuclease VII large subunit [Candidatus Saccharimonadales bacterium]